LYFGSKGEYFAYGVNAHVLGRNWNNPEAPLSELTEFGW
jgi:hypothetical protein